MTRFMTRKNILIGTLTFLLLRTLFPPCYGHEIYFLLNLPSASPGFVSYGALLLEYLVIILIGLVLYQFKKD